MRFDDVLVSNPGYNIGVCIGGGAAAKVNACFLAVSYASYFINGIGNVCPGKIHFGFAIYHRAYFKESCVQRLLGGVCNIYTAAYKGVYGVYCLGTVCKVQIVIGNGQGF